MSQILYIPGFNENDSVFESLQETLGESTEKMCLPGHEGAHKDVLFSISATRETISDILTERRDISAIITTSLSAWPVIEALENSSSTVKKLLLLNPAYDPFASVVRMFNANPLIQRAGLGKKEDTDFLQEDKSIFQHFLGGGRIEGDPETFQKDLQKFFEMGYTIENEFFSRIQDLRERDIETRILCNPKDEIIFGRNEEGNFMIPRFFEGSPFIKRILQGRESKSERLAAYSSHIPVFTEANRKMIADFFSQY